ncbi:DUF4038 domain-containing protein [Arcticibacter tournemirensis]|uniref:DUF4038 domain-containing protein n=1 Tax=Arcticibacter tournemirensis TaxID=699437 RepID=A0A5M9HEI2_9SPHI|nr:DUF4038 domain-containing protein [Arcticibacter tournemirensis]
MSASKRYIETQNKKPFLWIGDTAWELFHKLTREEADIYLSKRAQQGFTVVQAVILAENDGLRTPNAYGDLPLNNLSPEYPNEKYFEHVDYIINKAEELGLFIAMLPTWGDKVFSNRPGPGPVVFNELNSGIFGEFLGRRYREKPVIWVLGGDRNIENDEVMNIWRSMARGLSKGDNGNHLITYHPAGEASSSQWFQNEEWLDFNMYQSGHASRFMKVYKFAGDDYSKLPVKPFLEAEPAYEDIPVQFWNFIDWKNVKKVPDSILNADSLLIDRSHFKKGFFTDYDVRVHAYWNFLAGACGYTYGNNAVWQMFKKGAPYTIPCLTDWEEALGSPGAYDMQHVKKLFTLRPFSQIVPFQEFIRGENPEDSTHIRAARAQDNSFALVYLSTGQTADLNINLLKSKKLLFWWYDPRNGSRSKTKKVRPEVHRQFSPPSSEFGNDWILVFDRK